MPGDEAEKDSYIQLLNCRTPEEVHERIRRITSDLSDREHQVRSMIFDIHSDVERRLKALMYQILLALVFHGEESEFEESRAQLRRMVERLGFNEITRLLTPVFNAFPAPDLGSIGPLNELRNKLTHVGDIGATEYKGRNPFTDADCLAEIFFDWQGIAKEIDHFYERMIGDPQYRASEDAKFRREHGGLDHSPGTDAP